MPPKHSTKQPPKQARASKRADSPPARTRRPPANPKTAGRAGTSDGAGPHASKLAAVQGAPALANPFWEDPPGHTFGDELIARMRRYVRRPTMRELRRRLAKRFGADHEVERVTLELVRKGALRCTSGVFWLPPASK